VIPCNLVITSILEERAASIHKRVEKAETVGYTKMLVSCCHNPKDHSRNFHYHENLKSHTSIDFIRLEILKKVERPSFLADNLAKNVHVLFE
jgi:hypothetical protein